ncbi:MAG TPA: histidine phosphatase family protein [Acidimicrobiia bacterium]|nr:histidine phosphatase family protein [Acidimicrobiia bacterium]
MTATAPGIWLVRHGDTEWSQEGRHTGRTDLPLLPTGEDEALGLAPRLRDQTFALVLTSPLRRARDTARLAGYPDAVVDEDLLEWDYGDYEGVTSDEIRVDRPGWTIWNGDPPGGETAPQVQTRVQAVIARCEAAPGDTLLFAHGHILRALTAVYLGFNVRNGAQFALETATLNVLGHEHEDVTLRRWNA